MKQLRELEERKKALHQMVQLIQQSCEQKVYEYNSKAREVWKIIGEETGIDLENILWQPHPSENKIVPVQINLNNESLTK